MPFAKNLLLVLTAMTEQQSQAPDCPDPKKGQQELAPGRRGSEVVLRVPISPKIPLYKAFRKNNILLLSQK